MRETQLARQTARKRLAYRLERRDHLRLARILGADDWQHVVMALTGTDWGGDYAPPFAKTYRYKWADTERVFANNNDGMELWFGYHDKWEWHIGNNEVKALTKWLIWDWWIKARWLGLRRPIYYWALHSGLHRGEPWVGADRLCHHAGGQAMSTDDAAQEAWEERAASQNEAFPHAEIAFLAGYRAGQVAALEAAAEEEMGDTWPSAARLLRARAERLQEDEA